MKFLIPEDEFGVFADQRGVPRVDSLFVAATFEKQHYNVLRDIGRITASNSGLSPEFIALNFEGNTYRDARGRKLPRYLLTRDGFTMLVMGYTGSKAMHFKELYIQRFNEMEQCIRPYLTAQQIHALDRLQHLDYGLLYSCPDFQQRKQMLTSYYLTELGGMQ